LAGLKAPEQRHQAKQNKTNKQTNMSLKGKTAVILAGTGNVGAAAAYGFLQEGAKVIITGRSQQKIGACIIRV
jgi:glutamate dehydrogenase/leucine dehydrogenase